MDNKEKFELTDILIQLEQIDYISIISMLSPIISYYTTSKVIDGYKLHKDFKPKNISRVSLPPELTQEYSSVDIENLASQRFGEAVVEFAKLVMTKFSSNNLLNFYNNLNQLKVVPKKFGLQNLVFKTNIAGTSDAKKNQIQVDGDGYTKTIYHELFHMASSTYKDGVRYSGFRQSSFKPGIANLGKALTEGYTQLLTERYFGYIEEVRGTYEFEVHIADKLEKIVGQEKMENLYLNANLRGLINELKIYASEEEIMKFISGTDFLREHLDDKKLVPFEKGMITSSLKNVNEFLFRVYTVKLKRQLDNGTLDMDEFNENLATYISSLGTSLKSGKHRYEFLTPEILQETLRTILDAPDLTVNIRETTNESISKGR